MKSEVFKRLAEIDDIIHKELTPFLSDTKFTPKMVERIRRETIDCLSSMCHKKLINGYQINKLRASEDGSQIESDITFVPCVELNYIKYDVNITCEPDANTVVSDM